MNEINPLVSILIPLYNAEKYFAETMESLLAQSYENIEIIIVNDGSTDGSLDIARQYESQHKQIKVYTQENSGTQVARNKAFDMSEGEYIQYFDADDIMHPDKISSQMKVLSEHNFEDNIVATGVWGYFVDSIEKNSFPGLIINKSYDDKFLYFKDAWENEEYIIGQSWLISRDLNKRIGKWNTSLKKNQDGEFFTKVAYNANEIIFVKESIVYYRKGISTSLSSDKSVKAMRSQLDSYRAYADLVKNDLEKHSLHKAVATLYSLIYRVYYPLDREVKEEVLNLLKDLGYNKPIVKFSPKLLWIVRLFGVDSGLYLRNVRLRLVKILNLYKEKY